MLARESRFSFHILREEREFITNRAQERVSKLIGASGSKI